jgi:hypothetical protein
VLLAALARVPEETLDERPVSEPRIAAGSPR